MDGALCGSIEPRIETSGPQEVRRGAVELLRLLVVRTDAGGTIRQLDDTQRAAWVDAMRPIWDQFADDVGQDMIDAAQTFNTGS